MLLFIPIAFFLIGALIDAIGEQTWGYAPSYAMAGLFYSSIMYMH